MVTLAQPTPLATLIPDIKNHLGIHHGMLNRTTCERSLMDPPFSSSGRRGKDVQTIAICAGSGGSAFGSVKADLYWTGEMSHVSPPYERYTR
jgi:putative NIF3 family GTP cyclohydrolase 1 type 2